ncbi:MAG: beta strand repeat-containing protein [Gaiellaceae bacterium]
MSAIKSTLSKTSVRNRRILAVLIGLCLAGASVAAWAFWTVSSGSGSGASHAGTVNQGATPTVSATGRKVTVSWGASTLSNGAAVDGYTVKRYDASTDALQTTLTDCTGTITGTTCDEKLVPGGDWKYTVTPKFHSWTGAESAKSGTVTVNANIGLSLDKSLFGTPDQSSGNYTVTGTLVNFDPSETLSFKLDDPSTGTALSGTPSAADGDGNASISVSVPTSVSDGAHTIYVIGGNGSNQASSGIVVDTSAPTVTPGVSPTPNGAGWNITSPVSVTLSGDDGTGSGVKFIKYTTDGSDPTVPANNPQTYSGPISISSTSTVKYFAEDNAGNDTSVQSQDVKIDTTAPDFGSPALTLSASGSFAAITGTTAFYNPAQNTGSSITVNAPNVTDPGSGIAKVNFPAITDFTGGGDDSSSPYSSTYSGWTSGSSSGSQTVTAYNNADLSNNSATFTLTPDSTAPSTPDAPTITGANANGYYTAASIPVTLPSTTPTDTGSGLAGQQLQHQSVALSGGTCGDFDTVGSAWSNVTLHSGADTTGVSGGNCYRYRELASDRVGNSTPSVVSGTAKVDTTSASFGSPALTLSESDASDFVSGTTLFYNPQGTNTGAFTVSAANVADAQSGLLKVNFPSLSTGFTGGGDDTSSPYSSDYTWDAAQAANSSGSQTVTASNNAGNTNTTTTFTLTKDTTNPVSGSITVASGSTTGTYTGTKTNYSDGTGSGMASNVLTRETATLTNGTCGTFGSLTTITSISETSAPSGCYRYTLTGTDNVGNLSSTSQIVQVDSTKPDFGSPALSITANNGQAFVNGTNVYLSGANAAAGSFTVSAPNIADPESGITKVNFPAITGTTGSGDDTTSPFSATYAKSAGVLTAGATSRTVTATNGATNTQTTTFTSIIDTAVPGSGALAANTGTSAGAISGFLYNSSGTYALNRTDYTETQNATNASGLASSTLTVAQGTYDPTGTTAATVCKSFGSESAPITGAPSITGATEGCYRYTLTGTDNVGNAATSTVTVVVDQTAPSMTGAPANVQLVNGGTAAQAGQLTAKADHVDITFPEAMKVSSICSNWTTGDGTDQTISGVTVTITDGTVANGNNDVLTISGGCTTGRFGSIDLGSNAYVSGGNVTFSGSGNNTSKLDYTASTHKLVLSLGAAGGATIGAVINSSTAVYTPNSLITDSAGNAITGTFNTGAVKQF